MDGLDLNENPEMPDLSGVRAYFEQQRSIENINFIGNITINCKPKFTQEDFNRMFRQELENIRRDTRI